MVLICIDVNCEQIRGLYMWAGSAGIIIGKPGFYIELGILSCPPPHPFHVYIFLMGVGGGATTLYVSPINHYLL